MSTQNDSLKVGDVMLAADATPQTKDTTMLKEALELMDQHRLGIVCITSADGTLNGIITDGDIRRMLNAVQKPIGALMSDDVINHAVRTPIAVSSKTPLKEAVALMVNGFCKEVFNELPLEFASEADRLLSLKLEGSVG